MGSLPEAELSLDFRPTTTTTTTPMATIKATSSFLSVTIAELLKEVSVIGDSSEKACRLDEFVKGLEEEMRKIDAFKRELPLCMLLVKDAILFLKEEIVKCREESKKQVPVLEEFIPLKKNSDNDGEDGGHGELHCSIIKKERDCIDKKNWMRSVQLWSNGDDHRRSLTGCLLFDSKQNPKLDSKVNKNENGYINEDRSRSAASLFMPFKPYADLSRKEGDIRGGRLPVPDLSLSTPVLKDLREESGPRTSGGRAVLSSSAPYSPLNLRNGPHVQPPQLQTSKKQRRCWSPELHRRFVNALQQLGGCQAATPKQVRELMQVDGLTNDEVKSHLQKYRLHTRRLPPTATPKPANQSNIASGDWRMSQDQCGESSRGASSQSGSPQGPLDLTMITGTSTTGGGENMEDDEDAKSEGYSGKKHVHKVDV